LTDTPDLSGYATNTALGAKLDTTKATYADRLHWNDAYSWGNHALAGYLTSFTEVDPIHTTWLATDPISDFARVAGSMAYADVKDFQPLLTNPVTGTGVAGYFPIWTGTNTIDSSGFYKSGEDYYMKSLLNSELGLLLESNNTSAGIYSSSNKLVFMAGHFSRGYINFAGFNVDAGLTYRIGDKSIISDSAFAPDWDGNKLFTMSKNTVYDEFQKYLKKSDATNYLHQDDLDGMRDTLAFHSDSLVSVYDSLAKHSGRYYTLRDSVKVDKTDIANLKDSIAKQSTHYYSLRDSVKVNYISIAKINDSISKHSNHYYSLKDSVKNALTYGANNSISISKINDSIAAHTVHYYTLRDSVKADKVSIAKINDSITKHSNHYYSLRDSVKVDKVNIAKLQDSIAKHKAHYYTLRDSVKVQPDWNQLTSTALDYIKNKPTISAMVYPGAGIPVSTGSSWETSITNNSTNWDTAYGWGNHASAGYQLSLGAASGYPGYLRWTGAVWEFKNETYAPTANPTFTGLVTAPSVRSGQRITTADQRIIVCDGDSRTVGYTGGTAYPYSSHLGLGATYTVYNTANGGATMTYNTGVDCKADVAYANVDPYYNNIGVKNIVVIWAGINDMYSWDKEYTYTYNALVEYCKQRRAKGWEVIVCTEINCTDAAIDDSRRINYNNAIRLNYQGFADWLCDLGNTAHFNTATSHEDLSYYLADGTHLTATGYQAIANAVSASITEYLTKPQKVEIFTKKVILTPAQLMSLSTSPIQLLPAYSHGIVDILNVKAALDFTSGTDYWTASSSVLNVYCADATSTAGLYSSNVVFYQSHADCLITLDKVAASTAARDLGQYIQNKAIYIKANTNFIPTSTGTYPINIYVTYTLTTL
jgi:lysophospholipase L1-like esterase